jgi:BirA family biotin operon repressor/biotin-[acetyl-CoA-carboxylase] ligase
MLLTKEHESRIRIVTALKKEREPISGEVLSSRLGMSRVALWRHVRSLAALGYGIEVSRRGYLLCSGTDLLLPWEFPNLAGRIAWTAETSSTMDEARRFAERGAAGGTVLVAETQTGGRGRNGRGWSSGTGGIYATFLYRLPYAAMLLPRLTMAAAAGIAACLERLCGLRASLKWPNDVLIGGLKVAGVLTEASVQADRLRWFAIGVGINVSNTPRGVPRSTTLSAMAGGAGRAALFEDLCREMDARTAQAASTALAAEWNRRGALRGRRVEIATPLGRVSGRAAEVDEWGAILVRREDGALQRVPAGDCVRVGEEG